ncbi:MAG: glycosyltransferase family 4 protein [Syntrophales bacterium]
MNTELRTVRVCMVSPLYHPSLGGVGRQAQLLTEHLADEGAEVFVIARRMKNTPAAFFHPKVKVLRAWSLRPYQHNYERVTVLNILTSLSFSVSCACLLVRTRNRYDLVHFHGASLPFFFNFPLLRVLGKKVIAKVAAAKVGTEPGSLRGRYWGLGNRIRGLLRKVDAFVATTAEIEEGLRQDGFTAAGIIRIPNFVDFSVFSPGEDGTKAAAKRSMGFGEADLVTFSGRFVPRKGIIFLLRAWRDVVAEKKDARLLLLGDGPLREEMTRAAREIGIADSVIFRGQVNAVAEYLRVTDLFVLPSLQEGMPNALLEAMACGLPVVATRIGGVVDIVADGENGILVEPGNPADMSAAILRLLRDPALTRRISAAARATVERSYSLDSIGKRYLALYRALIPT